MLKCHALKSSHGQEMEPGWGGGRKSSQLLNVVQDFSYILFFPPDHFLALHQCWIEWTGKHSTGCMLLLLDNVKLRFLFYCLVTHMDVI